MHGLHDRWQGWRRRWQLARLRSPEFAFMFAPPPPNEWVALDCETTGLNVRSDEIIAIGAVRIAGQRVMTSERLELLVRPRGGVSPDSVRVHRLRARDVADGLPVQDAVKRLMHFVGSRPLVGVGLPQPCIEVSALYHDYKFRQLPPSHQQGNVDIDLRFATLMADLSLPTREAHDALNDAVMAALAFIKLQRLRAG